jgi:hypothetical protein
MADSPGVFVIGSKHQLTAKSAKKRLTHKSFNTAAAAGNTSTAAEARSKQAERSTAVAVDSKPEPQSSSEMSLAEPAYRA